MSNQHKFIGIDNRGNRHFEFKTRNGKKIFKIRTPDGHWITTIK